VKKAGKKTAKKKDQNESSSQASETKESTASTDSKVNGNKPVEDKDNEPTPVPVLTKEEEEELALQRKEDRKRKDQEFLNQLAKAVARSAIQPLGRDRVFRRYWAFRSLRGLFVEDDDPDQHLLLDPESDSESEVIDLRSKAKFFSQCIDIVMQTGDANRKNDQFWCVLYFPIAQRFEKRELSSLTYPQIERLRMKTCLANLSWE